MTIEVPTPSADLIAQIETATIETSQHETAAVAAIRERFTPYAKHAGYVKIAWSRCGNSNWTREDEMYYERDGKRVRALLVRNEFGSDNTDQNRGNYTGYRVYLTQHGEWLKIRRDGNWSAWQGEAEEWGCGVSARSGDQGDEYDIDSLGGSTNVVADEDVARLGIPEMLAQLGKSMTEMCAKLPERFAKLRARAEMARKIVEVAK